ncbi:hypothetical protein COF64_00975 [Bacillus sp. AFS043905]|nr:hypothetical protein COF64_00975 [Bacillus sp. AFS043905]TWE03499.1 hypothetical protein FB545_0571 [Peribacillus frigoritolerans]
MKDKLALKSVWNKTSQQFLILKHKVDWNGRYETPAGKAWHRRPRRRAEEAPARPRKASAWSGNQRSHFTNPQKSCRQTIII